MNIEKGTQFIPRYTKDIFEVVGTWCGHYVLASQNPDTMDTLIYSEGEMTELQESGKLRRLK